MCEVLRREGGYVLKMALDFVIEGYRKKRRLTKTWKNQVEEGSIKVGLSMEDALCQCMWIVGASQIAITLR